MNVFKNVSDTHQLWGTIIDGVVHVSWETWYGYPGAVGPQPLDIPYQDPSLEGWEEENEMESRVTPID